MPTYDNRETKKESVNMSLKQNNRKKLLSLKMKEGIDIFYE